MKNKITSFGVDTVLSVRHMVLGAAFLMLVIGGLAPGIAFAAPQRLPVKSDARKVREKTAQNTLKTVDLRDIQDPAARIAIREILNYLNLEAKK